MSVQRELRLDDARDLWLGMLHRSWRSLALVPAAPGGSASPLARALCEVGAVYRGCPLPLLSASNLTLDTLAQFVDNMTRMGKATNGHDDGQGLVVVLDSVISNPLGIAVALAADAVLLVIELGKSDERSAQRTVELIGHDHFIGSVALR